LFTKIGASKKLNDLQGDLHSRIVRFFEHDMLCIKLPNFETELLLKLLLLWTAKQNTLFIIDCNLFNVIFSFFEFLSFSLHSQSQHLQSHKQQQHQKSS